MLQLKVLLYCCSPWGKTSRKGTCQCHHSDDRCLVKWTVGSEVTCSGYLEMDDSAYGVREPCGNSWPTQKAADLVLHHLYCISLLQLGLIGYIYIYTCIYICYLFINIYITFVQNIWVFNFMLYSHKVRALTISKHHFKRVCIPVCIAYYNSKTCYVSICSSALCHHLW